MKASIAATFMTVVLTSFVSQAFAQQDQPAAQKFIVHEWGVQVRTLAKVKVSLGDTSYKDANLMVAMIPPAELISDLPAFVLRHGSNYTPQRTERDWKKPLIHLYGPAGLEVGIEILTPLGTPLAYWPKPKYIERSFSFMGSTIQTAVGMKWSGKLATMADGNHTLAKVDEKHWWNIVRKVPSRYFQTDDGTERFVFYEATAVQEPSIAASISADVLKLQNTQPVASGPILMIANDLGTRHFMQIDTLDANAETVIKKEDLLKADGDEKNLLAACTSQWKTMGMTEAESQAIVETWKPDLLDRAGLLVISRISPALYEQMFPLKITPKPDELVRVGMVFDTLAGQGQRMAWLPSLKTAMGTWSKDLADANEAIRNQAGNRLAQTQDLFRDMLENLSKSPDPEVNARASRLLEMLEPVTIELPYTIESARKGQPTP